MRVGIYTHYIDKYPRSAPSLYQAELIKKLLEKTNLDIVLIHHKKSDLPIYKLAEEVVVPGLPYLREHEVNKLDLDLVHFNAIPWSWWPFIAKLNIPSVATVHGTIHWDAPHLDDYTSLILRILKKALEKQVMKYITYFIAVSGHVRNVLINKLKVPDSKIEVTYLPIDHTVFKPLDSEIVQKVKIKYGIKSKYILHVSAFSKRKNPQTLFKVFYMIKKKVRDIILVIAGSSWNNSLVRKLINELNLQGHVKMLGWVPREDLVALYNGAELFLFPSLHENFGFPLVEAMACGTPIVSSKAFAIPEVVDDAGLLCNPQDYECFANAILEILSNSQIREEIIERGLKRAKIFNWDDHIKKIIMIYKQVINKNRWE